MAKRDDRDMVFHNALVEASPIRVRVDDEPFWLKSKGVYLVSLTLYDNEGSKTEAKYWAENEDCGEFFKGRKGETLTIVASGGGKGAKEKASAKIEEDGGGEGGGEPERRQSQQSSRAPQSQSRTAPQISEENAVSHARVFAARRISLRKLCVKAIKAFSDECVKQGMPAMPPESFWAQVTSLCISVEAEGLAIRRGFADAMPVNLDFATLKPVHSGKSAAQKQEKKKPEPATCKVHGCVLTSDGGCPQCEAAEAEKAAQETDDVPF